MSRVFTGSGDLVCKYDIYDFIILYTGVVEFSPRPLSNFIDAYYKNNDVISNFLLKYYYKTGKVILSNNEKLEKDFDNIKCVISFNSSATVEALFAGIRVINLARSQPCFSAASNKLSEIENLTDLNRDIFLKKIAFLHWENNELDSFENKKYLCNLLEKSSPLNNNNNN